MATDSGYPSNTFKQGVLNSLYGGETGAAWGGKALTFHSGWLRDIADWLLTWQRKPYQTRVTKVQEAVVMGDLLAFDLASSVTDAGGLDVPYIRKIGSGAGATSAIVIGVALETAASGAECHYATGGPLPSAFFTGLTGLTAGTPLSANLTTSKLKVWVAGEEVLAYANTGGSVLLLPPARMP